MLSIFFLWSFPFIAEASFISYDLIRKLYPGPLPSVYHSPPSSSIGKIQENKDISLRQAASAKGIFMGAAINAGHLQGNDSQEYKSVDQKQYSLITPENACKWSATEPERGQFSYRSCDVVFNSAQVGNQAFRGHNLCWGVNNPLWLANSNFRRETLTKILENHIENVAGQYNGSVYAWDVVNEAIQDFPGVEKFKVNVWYPKLIDPLYLDIAFTKAREVDPKAKLFYNDYGAEGMNDKSNAVYKVVKDMKNRGVPIDGVGLQMHISVDHAPSPTDIKRNMQRLANLGLEIHITELDIRCGGSSAACNSTGLDLQANIYAHLLQTCLDVPECKNFETWGFTDKYTWIWNFQNPDHVNEMPLPFDMFYHQKPAFGKMIQILTQ